MVEIRAHCAPEQIEMHAHEAQCRYCKTDDGEPGTVKMWCDRETFLPMPDHCSCLLCGQHYYVVVDDVWTWMAQQWNQKNQRVEKNNES